MKTPTPPPAFGAVALGLLAVVCCAGPVLLTGIGLAGILTFLRAPLSLSTAAVLLALLAAAVIVKRSRSIVSNPQRKD